MLFFDVSLQTPGRIDSSVKEFRSAHSNDYIFSRICPLIKSNDNSEILA